MHPACLVFGGAASALAWLLPPWLSVLRYTLTAVSVLLSALGLSLATRLQLSLGAVLHSRRQREVQRRIAEQRRRAEAWTNSTPPTLSADAPPRFAVNDPQLLAYLDEHGFAVVAGVADSAEVGRAQSLLWEYLEMHTDMKRDDPASWSNNNFRAVGDPVNGILSGGFGHAEVSWFVRTLPKVKQVFERLWHTSALITSFDGGNVFRPTHGPGGARHHTIGGWWHVDQGSHKRGRHAVQGLVLLTHATEYTGGLCVVPGSHKLHDELMSYTATSPDGQDYVVVPSPQSNPLVHRGTLVVARAGDMILWDSRTVHCNTPGLKPPTTALGYHTDELLRAVVYVCMTPRRFASRAALLQRRRAALAGVGSSHWPHDFKPACDPAVLERVTFFGGLDKALEKEVQSGRMSARRRALIG